MKVFVTNSLFTKSVNKIRSTSAIPAPDHDNDGDIFEKYECITSI